jgi:hypothetical protein
MLDPRLFPGRHCKCVCGCKVVRLPLSKHAGLCDSLSAVNRDRQRATLVRSTTLIEIEHQKSNMEQVVCVQSNDLKSGLQVLDIGLAGSERVRWRPAGHGDSSEGASLARRQVPHPQRVVPTRRQHAPVLVRVRQRYPPRIGGHRAKSSCCERQFPWYPTTSAVTVAKAQVPRSPSPKNKPTVVDRLTARALAYPLSRLVACANRC